MSRGLMVLHCGQEWGWGAEVLGSPQGAPASVAGRDPAADSQVDVAGSPGDQHSPLPQQDMGDPGEAS